MSFARKVSVLYISMYGQQSPASVKQSAGFGKCNMYLLQRLMRNVFQRPHRPYCDEPGGFDDPVGGVNPPHARVGLRAPVHHLEAEIIRVAVARWERTRVGGGGEGCLSCTVRHRRRRERRRGRGRAEMAAFSPHRAFEFHLQHHVLAFRALRRGNGSVSGSAPSLASRGSGHAERALMFRGAVTARELCEDEGNVVVSRGSISLAHPRSARSHAFAKGTHRSGNCGAAGGREDARGD